MARITVEDCLVNIPNRFQLVLAATYRARMLSQGHAPKIESKNKPAVTALREIAAGNVRFNENVKDVVTSFIADRKVETAEARSGADARRAKNRTRAG